MLFTACYRNVLLEGCEKDARLVGCPIKQLKQDKEQTVDSIRESREDDYFDDEGVLPPPPPPNPQFAAPPNPITNVSQKRKNKFQRYALNEKIFWRSWQDTCRYSSSRHYLKSSRITITTWWHSGCHQLSASICYWILPSLVLAHVGLRSGRKGSTIATLRSRNYNQVWHYNTQQTLTLNLKESMGVAGVWSFISCSHNSDR